MDNVVIDTIFHVRAGIRVLWEESGIVGLIVCKEQRHISLAMKAVGPQLKMPCDDGPSPGRRRYLLECRLLRGSCDPGRPIVAEPECGKQMKFGRFGAAVYGGNLHEDILGTRLGIFHKNVKVSVLRENAGIKEFILHVLPRSMPVRLYKIRIWKCRLRIFIEVLHVGMGSSRVEIKVVLLHIFPVVPFAIGQAKEALFEDRVFAVPESQGKAKMLSVIGNPCQPILSPSICPGSRLVMREVIPGIAVFTIVLAYGSPLPLGEIWPPLPPWCSRTCVVQSSLFCVQRFLHHNQPPSLTKILPGASHPIGCSFL